METIRSYIDNLFRSYPHTPKVQKARAELLEIMEDKYNELKSQGRSENEAIGIVISEFGNMEEIAAELEADTFLDSRKDGDDREVYPMNSDQVKEFVTKQIFGGNLIALGVALCILAPGMACIITTLGDVGVFPRALADTLGGIWLIGMVAVGVGILIIQGLAIDSREKRVKGKKILLDYSTRSYVESELEAFGKQFGIRIAAGVVLCIVSVLPAVLLDALSAGEAGYSDLSGAFLFFLVAAGVSCFITAGVRKDSYEILLGIGKVSAPSGKEDKVMSVVSSVYWLTVTLIYLLWSFYNNAWVTSWVIWPVAGIAFGIVSVIVKAVTGKEN